MPPTERCGASSPAERPAILQDRSPLTVTWGGCLAAAARPCGGDRACGFPGPPPFSALARARVASTALVPSRARYVLRVCPEHGRIGMGHALTRGFVDRR